MVKLPSKFKEKIEKQMKEPASPERGSSRKLLKTGGRKCVTLRPDWCRQWGLESGSKVLLFVDENDKLVITPATSIWRKVMEKYYSIIERKIVEVGNSLAVAVPNDILKEELGWETRKLLRSSDYATIYEPYDVRRQEKIRKEEREEPKTEQKKTTTIPKTETEAEKPEQEGMRRSVKIVTATTVVFGIAMAIFIFQASPSGNATLNVSEAGDWTSGNFNNTVLAGRGIQLAPDFMEDCEQGWVFTPDENKYTAENWPRWYTQGTGSVAIGKVVKEQVLLKTEISAEKTLNLSGVNTLIVDIFGKKEFTEEFMAQEIQINGDTKFRKKNKDFKNIGYEIDVSNYGNNTPFTISIKNISDIQNQPINWLAPTLAVDAIRSQKLKSNSGTYTSKWQNFEKNVSWDNLIVETILESNTSASLTFQVSNNGQSVQNSKKIQLEDGTNSYKIPALSGEYARLKISMQTQDQKTTPKIISVKASS